MIGGVTIKKKHAVLIRMVLATAMIFSACSADPVLIDPTNAQAPDYVLDSGLMKEYTVSEYEIFLPDDCERGCISSYGSALYYTVAKPTINLGQYVEYAEVYKIDTESGQTEKIGRIENGPYWVNELTAVDSALFWVIMDIGGTRIERYDLESGTTGVIREFSPESLQSISLSGNQDYVTWFEDAEEKTCLYACDAAGNDIRLVSDQISLHSPFTRGYIKDGVMAFSIEKGGAVYLCAYDFEEQSYMEQVRIPDTMTVLDPQANGEFIVWRDAYGYLETSVYVYSLGTGELKRVIEPEGRINAFSFHLTGDTVFVNDRKSNQIVAMKLSESSEVYLTEELSGEHHYLVGAVLENGGFIAYDKKKQCILYITNT